MFARVQSKRAEKNARASTVSVFRSRPPVAPLPGGYMAREYCHPNPVTRKTGTVVHGRRTRISVYILRYAEGSGNGFLPRFYCSRDFPTQTRVRVYIRFFCFCPPPLSFSASSFLVYLHGKLYTAVKKKRKNALRPNGLVVSEFVFVMLRHRYIYIHT